MPRILIVDDDDSLRRAVRRTLEAAGFDVIEATSGASGLDAFRENRPDVLLTDVYMPGSDGLEGAKRVLAEFPDARIIVMTGGGWADRESVLENTERLGLATLPKPFTVEEVLSAVQRSVAMTDE